MESRILQHAWNLKKEGYRESTITSRVKALRWLARKAELLDPDSVKAATAWLAVTEARKENLVTVYTLFCRERHSVQSPKISEWTSNLSFQ